MHQLQKLFLLVSATTLIRCGRTVLIADVKWTHELFLETGFEVRWNSEDSDFLTMEVSAPTMGYVSVGFSPNGDMVGSDIMIAYVDSEGTPHVKDFHGVGKVEPVQDPVQQDYFLIAASEKSNRTTVRFYRRWETCDEEHDINIGTDTMKLIWAWHENDPSSLEDQIRFSWHGTVNRGTRNVHMRSTNRPLPFPDGRNGLAKLPQDVKILDLTLENVDLDGSRHSMMVGCKLFKFSPSLTHLKYQLIGFRPLITEENEGNIHRISVYQCHIPDIDESKSRQETEPFQCQNATSMFGKHCNDLLFTWALGSEGEMFPVHVGAELSSNHLKLQVHYDGLGGKQSLDSSGIRVFYTEHIRLYSSGVVTVGHRVSPFLAIPPSQEHFKIYSICSSDCTRHGIPESGLNIFSVMLHSHETGRRMKLGHIRNGVELAPIAQDRNYTFKYQPYHILKDEVRILQGDELILECEYDTLYRDKFTYGGHSNEEEMCQAFLYYYPKTNLTLCQSKPEFQSFFAGFGVHGVAGNGLNRLNYYNQKMEDGIDLRPPTFELEEMQSVETSDPFETVFITQPEFLFNSSISSRMKTFDWRVKTVSKNLENSWKDGKHFTYCEDANHRVLHKKYVSQLPKYQKHQKGTSSSNCRRSKRKNSGKSENKCLEIEVIAMTLFLKVIFDARGYFML